MGGRATRQLRLQPEPPPSAIPQPRPRLGPSGFDARGSTDRSLASKRLGTAGLDDTRSF